MFWPASAHRAEQRACAHSGLPHQRRTYPYHRPRHAQERGLLFPGERCGPPPGGVRFTTDVTPQSDALQARVLRVKQTAAAGRPTVGTCPVIGLRSLAVRPSFLCFVRSACTTCQSEVTGWTARPLRQPIRSSSVGTLAFRLCMLRSAGSGVRSLFHGRSHGLGRVPPAAGCTDF